jgi:hypothetical protein
MKPRLLAATALSLLALSAHAQQPGAGSTQITPASATPQTQSQPNLRTDSTPHTNLSPSTDSAPAPESLGVDATPIVDLGWDWSLPQDNNVPSVLKRIVTRKGVTTVVDVQTLPAITLPVTNPPDPPTVIIADIPEPPVVLKPAPPDPLTGIPQ